MFVVVWLNGKGTPWHPNSKVFGVLTLEMMNVPTVGLRAFQVYSFAPVLSLHLASIHIFCPAIVHARIMGAIFSLVIS